ncbi:hypothetical protein AAFP30_27760 [Gordonia sp. CPCC 205515]|uniref:hypothetical protein n=1 Tax=Gordonia sp. CPCC 205515 TaxID=3140791 RepID=UPI003AF3B4BC
MTGLFPDCPLPGCINLTHRQGHPCRQCLASFGDFLAHTPAGTPLTAAVQQQRDRDTIAAYRAQHEPAVERSLAIEAGQQTKPNQLCWLCDERRACVRVAGRWECGQCRHIAG